jgi:hypothetical protein
MNAFEFIVARSFVCPVMTRRVMLLGTEIPGSTSKARKVEKQCQKKSTTDFGKICLQLGHSILILFKGLFLPLPSHLEWVWGQHPSDLSILAHTSLGSKMVGGSSQKKLTTKGSGDSLGAVKPIPQGNKPRSKIPFLLLAGGLSCGKQPTQGKLIVMKPGGTFGKFEETSERGQDFTSCSADNDDYVCF